MPRRPAGLPPQHAWAIPLLVDSFIVIATGAELWLGVHPTRRAWWELAWPRALLAGAAMVSFVLNVAHAKAGDWPARGVAAIPPAALLLSVELLVMIARRAALARTHRLIATIQPDLDEPTTSGERATIPASDHAAAATSSTGDQPKATSGTGNRPPTALPAKATSDGQAGGGATYQRVRELYLGGMTVAAEIARELGVSASYAQRTLRRVKADLDREHDAPTSGPGRATTPKRTEPAGGDQQRDQKDAARSHDHLADADRDLGDQATSRTEATRDGDGRTATTNRDRHLVLVAPSRHRDQREVER
jgi:hypothetical protein